MDDEKGAAPRCGEARKRPRVIARVVAPGHCPHYNEGQEFRQGGFTPKGVCDSAYVALSRDAQTMRCGGTLPWQKDGKVLTRCPDPDGALWALRIEAPPAEVGGA
jgi:uncharacterized repeat protein (TIGR04076 family)